jgi:Fur family peroxide stress response transcriptional regulator
LSLGTVYRNLAQFKEDGLIISVGVIDGHERYDAKTMTHGHFVCKGCGSVIDIMDDHVPPEILHMLAEELDVQIDSHELTFYGLCKNCRVVKH